MIKTEGLCFSYGKKIILDHLDLNISKGEFISIIGANGSGKTTLMNCLSGLNENYDGQIYYQDKALSQYTIHERSKQFAYIAQNKKINFPFTCFEVVAMGRHPYKNRLSTVSIQDTEMVTQAMNLTDTYQFADELITEISGGEFQRVIFARTLVQRPNIIFLDEAFSSMDISHSVNALKILKEIVRKEEKTVIAVMHDINLAYRFSDKVCMLKKGKIVDYGRPDEIVDVKSIKYTFNIDVEKVDEFGFYITT